MDDTELAVMEVKVTEHEKLLKGNGSPGMYRTMIEMNGRVKRMEWAFWGVVGSALIAGAAKFFIGGG